MSRKLNVKSEDEVIDALIIWLKKNIELINENEILEILNNINWPYVSFEKLIELFK